MKRYRKQVACLFGAIAVFSYLSIHYFSTDDTDESITVMEESESKQLQIYVLDKDNTLIPMDKEIPADLALEEQLKQMIAAMCADQVKGEFSGVLGKGTALTKVKVDNGLASLYFNEQLTSYEKEQELQVLEAITWAATQFDEISQVQLYYKDELLHEMPLDHTPIPDPLDRSLGINHFESASASLNNSASIIVYYVKQIDGKDYFVPKSKRISGNGKDMETVVKEVLKDVSVSSELTAPLYQESISATDLPKQKDNTLIVNMNHALLNDERTAKQSAYEALILSLANNFDVDEVKVYVEDNVVSLHGSNEEAVSVSSLHYNPIPF
ncbi:MAG: spore gernimation protein GerM [Erysipelotrichaceae bacterium]|nr:spore gernimation protein GerM [Erysipelotrichaceae bacterium]